uniref:Cytochrome b5 heme-binding domain-containing protein n=1 Tax=Pyramimonas obovata TaxID=1411642 RepID=A0A7S0QVE4_9CHLO|mmetsp:Transcript_12719/g.26859  ORF Transcript_12719/g.26859 Transcript_12719/m.26859 type:complete len:443 (+) Transcript_12719:128-1456(+)|eukprot:CAMPEP_0118932988 /NCGR_PEP_ID=MMETSP1169-20130426/10865_1 /TAXON_ID=36882 /ORGANISM="Pyramimonas obovata, Strain CCMP722" /LENGTH=442 /DNA_ID=CAMNT_0006875697 /DNA_START=127 /DNA_END=1455 /DNA_ORIENTATION=-
MGKGGNASVAAPKKEVLIEGKFYDVTDFKHPGGSIIKFLSGSGADATASYREFHVRSKKADKFLKALPSREASAEEIKLANEFSKLNPPSAEKAAAPLTDLAKVEALNKDFEAFREQLIQEGFFKPNIPHVVKRVTEVAAMFVVASWMMLQTNALVVALGIAIHGIAQGRCGWLMHEGGHYSLTGNISIDRRLQELIYGLGCGMSGAWWRNQHNKHHATPQKLQHDVDLETLPLLAFHSAVTDRNKVKPGSLQAMWLKYQAFLFFPVTSLLVGLGWTTFLHPRHSFRTKHFFELFCMAVRYAGYTALFAPKFGVAGAAALYLATFAMGCNYIFINFSVSHTHLPVSGASEYLHWVVYSAIHTTNIKSSMLCDWWMSFLNFQIEHHLFPSMPQFRHKIISPRVKALFEKHGLVYDVRPYWGAMADTFHNLNDVGTHASHAKAH